MRATGRDRPLRRTVCACGARLSRRAGIWQPWDALRCYSWPIIRTSTDGAVKERVTPKTKQQEPTLYKVVLLNDDYTTMDFVIHVLEEVFQKSPAEAFRIMMQVHVNGRGIAGVYPWEVAETKVETVSTMARDAGYPLRAALEEG